MRVTQSMLSNNMLRNLSSSYLKMEKLQEQITSGSKINRPSDDPVVAIKGMGYRTDLNKVEQFERNMNEVNSWLDTSDDALGQVGEALQRVQELVTQAANDTNTEAEREKIKVEIDQIRRQIQDVANTKIGDKYIFSGTKTHSPLYVDGTFNTGLEDASAATGLVNGVTSEVKMEVFDGIQLSVNTPGAEVFQKVDAVMGKISEALTPGSSSNNGSDIGDLLGGIADDTDDTLTEVQNAVLEARADVGARQNRVELMANRLSSHEINVTSQMSENEDVDYAEAITQMVAFESIHQASLSVGAKIIQQTLVDFIR